MPVSTDVASLAFSALRANSRLNYVARLALLAFSLVSAALAVVYVHARADAMVEILRQPRAESELMGERLLALTAPVLLLVVLSGLSAVAVMVLHSRGVDETGRALDSINRLRREGEVAVSARGLIVAFEEQLGTTRKAFTLLLWFGRTLFIVCLGLFGAALVNALIGGVDLLTVVLGATSVAGVLLAVVLAVPRNVAHQLSNVVQTQTIVTGAQRQISLLESAAFAALNHSAADPAEIQKMMLEIQQRIDKVIDDAVVRIQTYTEEDRRPGGATLTLLPTADAA